MLLKGDHDLSHIFTTLFCEPDLGNISLFKFAFVTNKSMLIEVHLGTNKLFFSLTHNCTYFLLKISCGVTFSFALH